MLALSQTRTHNAANELQTIVNGGTTSFAYDQAGNTLSLPITPSGGTLSLSGTCIYDAWNRLVQVSSGTTTLASYSYDGLGRRTQKLNLTSSATTDYYLAGQQVVETDYTSGGITALQYQYVWSARYIDAPILRDDSTNGATYPRLYYLNDANFNVTSLTGTNGSVVERCVYDAYARRCFIAPMVYLVCFDKFVAWQRGALHRTRTRPRNGSLLLPPRYFSAGLGRFLSTDPFESDENFYAYCGNDPTNAADPAGLAPPGRDVTAAGPDTPNVPFAKDEIGSIPDDIETPVAGEYIFSAKGDTSAQDCPCATLHSNIATAEELLKACSDAKSCPRATISGHGIYGGPGVRAIIRPGKSESFLFGLNKSFVPGTEKVLTSLKSKLTENGYLIICSCAGSFDTKEVKPTFAQALQTIANTVGRKVCACWGLATGRGGKEGFCRCNGQWVCRDPINQQSPSSSSPQPSPPAINPATYPSPSLPQPSTPPRGWRRRFRG